MSRSLVLGALLAAVLAVGSASPSLTESPAADYYLKIEGIEGDGEDGSIAVAGIAWNTIADVGRFEAYSPRAAAGGVVTGREASTGMATGRRMHKPMTIVKEWGGTSAKLMQACAQGDPIGDVEVWMREGGQSYLRYTLKDAFITSYSVSRDPDPTARPIESISFAYETIAVAPEVPATERGSLNSSKSN